MQEIVNDVVVKNYGISFGQNIPGIMWISVLFLVVLVWMAFREKKLALWLAVAGGSLNLWERITLGYVVDYWKIPGIPLYNNINDWLIFGGIVWYLLETIKQKK